LLEQVRAFDGTSFLFESPFRITRLLGEIAAVCGPETRVALIREATKIHEECLRGTAQELLARHGERTWKGEFVVVLRPAGTTSSDELPVLPDGESGE
jgi:16S rRNA (cytidine1402-2'-O)-methyltransferase